MREKAIKLSTVVTELEEMQEKATIINVDLALGYFELSPEESVLYHKEAKVKNDIVSDYLHQMKNTLCVLRELVEGVQE